MSHNSPNEQARIVLLRQFLRRGSISPAIVQEFVGHDSKAVSQHYTHIELASLQTAADAMPFLDW
jgi:site-specific recombinase XerD